MKKNNGFNGFAKAMHNKVYLVLFTAIAVSGTLVLGAWISTFTGQMSTVVASTEPITFETFLGENAMDVSSGESTVNNTIKVLNADGGSIGFETNLSSTFTDVEDNCTPEPDECEVSVSPAIFNVSGGSFEIITVSHHCDRWSCPVRINSTLQILQTS